MRSLFVFLAMAFLLLSCTPDQSGLARDPSADEEAVWQLEEAYFRYVQAGDVENYLTLWDDEFVGWPCGSEQPQGKETIADWVQEIRDQNLQVEYELQREAVRAFGDVVATQYGLLYSDGTSEGSVDRTKITHTWRRSGETWKIITGMCGAIS